MAGKQPALEELLQDQPVVPVILIHDLAHAIPLAQALAKGGLPAIEITLRTPAALDAIQAVAAEVPEAVVGAGTILTGRQFDDAAKAGARFIVSPGSTESVLEAAEVSDVPLLPGAITPTEAMILAERGYAIQKFFPAEQAGGASFLKALSSPLSGIRFCPTGGVSIANARDYLSLPNVICVGGSWVAPDAEVKNNNWTEIEKLAREAAALKSSAA